MTSCIQTARAVKPSTGIEGTYLLNTCDRPVFAFWCHEGTGGSACGTEEYFKRGRKMEPDERYFNKYSLPANAAIHAGACSGTRRNVSFGGNGIGTYSCIKNDTPAVQPSDHTYIHCKDGRKLPYQWRRKYVKGDVTIIRLETGGQISWINMDSADFEKFTAEENTPVPAVFNSRLCNEKMTATGTVKMLKNDAIDELNQQHKEQRIECLEALTRTKECDEFLKPKSSGSSGVRG